MELIDPNVCSFSEIRTYILNSKKDHPNHPVVIVNRMRGNILWIVWGYSLGEDDPPYKYSIRCYNIQNNGKNFFYAEFIENDELPYLSCPPKYLETFSIEKCRGSKIWRDKVFRYQFNKKIRSATARSLFRQISVDPKLRIKISFTETDEYRWSVPYVLLESIKPRLLGRYSGKLYSVPEKGIDRIDIVKIDRNYQEIKD